MKALLGLLKLDILVFLVHLEYAEAAKLVLGNRDTSTEWGQMAYITKTRLRFNVLKESGSCKVGAGLNELVTQKEGEWFACGIVLMLRGMKWSSALPGCLGQRLECEKLVWRELLSGGFSYSKLERS